MDLSNLTPAKGSVKNRKRIARGEGSKKGGTSTRGHKGAKSRSGYSRKIGFEGGQMPLQRRVPKFGFTNPNRKEYRGVNLYTLQTLVDNKKIKDAVDLDIYCLKNGFGTPLLDSYKTILHKATGISSNYKPDEIRQTVTKILEELGDVSETVSSAIKDGTVSYTHLRAH